MHKLIRRVIKAAYRGSLKEKEFKDFPMRLRYPVSSHLNFFLQRKIHYEPNIQQKLKGYVRENTLIFDIGSNIGQYALPFSHLTGPQGRVIAFEPDPENFKLLKANIKRNDCGNVVVLNIGVGASCSRQTLYQDSLTGGRRGSFVKAFTGETFTGNTEESEIIDLKTAIQRYGVPAFVKVDVEGFEGEIIKGIEREEIRKTIFLIEVREETVSEVYDFFASEKFDCFQMDFKDPQEITNISMLPTFGNLIFIPSNTHV